MRETEKTKLKVLLGELGLKEPYSSLNCGLISKMLALSEYLEATE
jgi:hypothetical protein